MKKLFRQAINVIETTGGRFRPARWRPPRSPRPVVPLARRQSSAAGSCSRNGRRPRSRRTPASSADVRRPPATPSITLSADGGQPPGTTDGGHGTLLAGGGRAVGDGAASVSVTNRTCDGRRGASATRRRRLRTRPSRRPLVGTRSRGGNDGTGKRVRGRGRRP